MPHTCNACNSPVKTNDGIRCKKCSQLFHLLCVSLSAAALAAETKSQWICPNCRSQQRKLDNTNTPVRPSLPITPSWDNITQRNKKQASSTLDESLTECSLILAEIRSLRGDMNDLKLEFKEAKISTDKRMDNFESKLNEFKELFKATTAASNSKMSDFDLSLYTSAQRITALEDAQPHITQLEERVIKLEEVVQFHLHSALRNELEIVGIPEVQNENLSHIVLVAAHKVGVVLQESDIDWVERVGPKHAVNVNKDGQRSRLVVVRFLRRATRDAFFRAARSRRNITSSDLDLAGTARNVYFNERLTKANRQLFQEARRRAKACGFQHCWTKNGSILIRKDQGRPAISIRNQTDMDRYLRQSDTTVSQTPQALPPAPAEALQQ